MAILLLFVTLQAADFGTTLWFLSHGIREANPLVTALIGASGQPTLSVLLLKAAACGMAAYAWRSRRIRLLRSANIFFALCVGWNLLAIAI